MQRYCFRLIIHTFFLLSRNESIMSLIRKSYNSARSPIANNMPNMCPNMKCDFKVLLKDMKKFLSDTNNFIST